MTKPSRRFNTLFFYWLLLSWLFLFSLVTANGQPVTNKFQSASKDSLSAGFPTFRWVAPAVLTGTGLALSPNYPNSHFDRFYVRSELQATIHFRTHADDYLQYGPAIAWAGLSVAGIKGHSQLLDRVFIGLLAYGMSTVAVFGLKHATNELRPDGTDMYSFPSGHTANAFTGASLLDREFRDVSPWIPIGGYTMATTTGLLRMTNDRHWVSDVLVGAGIGLLSTEVAYRAYPWLKRKFSRHKVTPH
ncbi:phosphatase PAP2 family protein (plasmid) [Spirosoma sp. SC4-14]|uniref:phosphatase PAP2 family protein n=1 Tax=Spirosoma sp. SC4-14 TaxID=3128900 RepID=UPI0030CDCD20